MTKTRISIIIQILLLSAAVLESKAASLRRTQQCSGTRTQKTGEVLIKADGDASSLDSNDILALEVAFRDTLQEMAAAVDPCFQVLDVNIDPDTIARRRLESKHEEHHRKLGSDGFQFVLWFDSICFQCYGGPIFKHDGSRRNLLETTLTREEFSRRYSAKISEKPNLHEKISVVRSLSELQGMEQCSLRSYRQKSMTIEFAGNYSPLQHGVGGSLSQVGFLEDAMKQAYNSMNMPNSHTRDTHFRNLEVINYSFSRGTQSGLFKMKFLVWYGYRNGNPNAIFDTLINENDYDRTDITLSNNLSSLLKIEDCAYDIAAKYDRAPTQNEFLSALNLALELSDKIDPGFVTNAVGMS